MLFGWNEIKEHVFRTRVVCNCNGCAHKRKRNSTFPSPPPLKKKMIPFEAQTFMRKQHLFKIFPLQNDLVIVALQCLEVESAGNPLSHILSNKEAFIFAICKARKG